jgi:hypothetical protein
LCKWREWKNTKIGHGKSGRMKVGRGDGTGAHEINEPMGICSHTIHRDVSQYDATRMGSFMNE